MKHLFENWRQFVKEVDEEQPSRLKTIFMAGGPGSGKSYVLNSLALNFPVINADEHYEKSLKDDPDLDLGGKPAIFRRRKELKAELESLPPDSEEARATQQELDKQKEL